MAPGDFPHATTPVFLLFLGYVVYWYLQFGFRFPILGSLRAEFLLGTVLSVLAIFACLQRPPLGGPSLGGITALLFFCLLIRVPWSVDPALSWTVFVNRSVKFAMMALFITAFVTSPPRLWWFLAIFLLVCMRMCFEGLIGSVTGSLVWENQGIPRLHGATPNYEHPNSFAGMALGTLPFCLYLLPHVGKWLRLALLCEIGLALNVVVLTGSRTGYLAFAGAILVILARSRAKGKAFVVTTIVAIVLLPFIPQSYLERFSSIFSGKEKEGASMDARKEILSDAVQILKENPLGVGVSAFPVIRRMRFGRVQDTHNLYLEVATNLGVHGLLVFLAFAGSMLAALRRLEREFHRKLSELAAASRDPVVPPNAAERPRAWKVRFKDLRAWQTGGDLRSVYALLLAGARATFLFVVIRLFLGFFGMDFYEIYWWFALGMTYALGTIARLVEAVPAATNAGAGNEPTEEGKTVGRRLRQRIPAAVGT